MILDLISKTVRDYMAENGLAFTDFEQAAIIAHSGLPVLEKLERLKAFAAETADEGLKAQMLASLALKLEDMNAFYENRAGFVYVVQAYGDKGPEPIAYGYFSDAEVAYAHGMRQGCRFEIEKQRIMDANSALEKQVAGYVNPYLVKEGMGIEDLTIKSEYSGHAVADAKYGKDGVMTYFYSSEIERPPEENLKIQYDPESFENAFINVPNPFEYGDIVRLTTDENSHGIVSTSQAEWKRFLESANAGMRKGLDFFDSSIRVDFLQDSGRIGHGHSCPLFLEKYEPKEADEDCTLLWVGQGVLRGKNTLEWFTECYDDYKKRRQQAHK